ncbi:hypothetical protein L596_024448 [Steinernema carpocapsae]|uniref:Uncharacterized protein n=1 Tax=Steinernema carpocapsae TaxID=34508 RepID=A0A4U5MGS3_STECR|nr:hypothetical protein L596_024448 [Steinernema carpocapsae]
MLGLKVLLALFVLLPSTISIDVLPINPVKQHETSLVKNETGLKDEYKEIRRLLATVIRNAYAVQHQSKFHYRNILNSTHSLAVSNLFLLEKAIEEKSKEHVKIPNSIKVIQKEIPRWRTIFEMAPYFSTEKPLRDVFWEIGRQSVDFFFELLPYSKFRDHDDTIEAVSIFLQSIIEID